MRRKIERTIALRRRFKREPGDFRMGSRRELFS